MNSNYAYDLISQTGVSNIELEGAISKDCYCSFYYASYVLKVKFDLGEKAISKDWFCSWGYALYVLKSRFRLGEKRICQSMKFNSCDYLVKVMGYSHD